MKDKIGIFSFFAGAGFLDLGFEMTQGFETVWVNELHAPFMEIYKGTREKLKIPPPIFKHHLNSIEDFTVVDYLKELQLHMEIAKKEFALTGFIGGPPCPDFSVGGKNRGHEGENGKLSRTYIDLICKTRPDFFLFENVKGLWRTKKHRQFYESLKEQLVINGYYLSEKLINAIEYGAPQDRDRIILVGFHRDCLLSHNYPENGTNFLWNFNWDIARQYDSKKIFNLAWPGIEPFEAFSKKSIPEGLPKELTVEHWFNKNEVDSHPNRTMFFKPQAGLIKFERISEGDDKKKSYKRLHRWRYSPTAAYGNNEVHLHPYLARRISVAEALAIQSLPKDFVVPDSMTLTNAFKAIGNGVPFLAGKGLAITLLNFISSLKPDFKDKLNGEINGTKSCSIYQPVTQKSQLSILEPEEQESYKN